MDEIWDLDALYSNTFYNERLNQYFPEIDYYQYIPLEQLKDVLFKNDVPLVDKISQSFEKYI